MEQIPKYASAQEVDPGEENSSTLFLPGLDPATFRSRVWRFNYRYGLNLESNVLPFDCKANVVTTLPSVRKLTHGTSCDVYGIVIFNMVVRHCIKSCLKLS